MKLGGLGNNGRELQQLPNERLCTPSAFKPVAGQQMMINQLSENLLHVPICVANTESVTGPTNFHVLNSGWSDGKNITAFNYIYVLNNPPSRY